MSHNAIAEKRVLIASAGAVKILIRQHNMPGRILLLQTTHRRHTNQPPDPQAAQGPNVGAMIDFMWKQSVTTTMPGYKPDLPTRDHSTDQSVRRVSERCLNMPLLGLLKALHLIEATTPDYSYSIHACVVGKLFVISCPSSISK